MSGLGVVFLDSQKHDSQEIGVLTEIPNLNRMRAKLNVGTTLFLENLNGLDKFSASTVVSEILQFPPSM